MPAPRLLIDAEGEVAAFASVATLFFGSDKVFFYRYVDGTREAIRLLLHALPAVAAALECVGVGGYGPTLPWLLEILDQSPVYQRGTATEQHEFHWKPAEFDSLGGA